MDKKITELIKMALIEDGYENDVTTLNLVDKDVMLSGSFIVKATGVVSGIDVSRVETPSRFAVVLGNEGSGVSQDIQDYLQQNIYIKMLNTESLNVAIAGSIIMYELTKKLI